MKALLYSLLLAPITLFGATYYVATGGNDSNNGSQGSPWKTIGKAISFSSAGDTVNIAAGTYTEAPKFTKTASANSRITFTGAGTGTVIKGNISFSGSYTTLDNCRMDSPGYGQYGAGVSIAGSYNECKRVTINTFGNTTASNQAAVIQTQSGSDHNLVDGCTITDQNDIDAFHLFGTYNTVQNCTVARIRQLNYSANHTDLLQTWSVNGETTNNISVLNNSFSDSPCQGGNTEGNGNWSKAFGWTLANNTFSNIDGAFFWGLPNSKFYGNVWKNCGADQGYSLSLYGSEPKYRSSGFEMKNNVFQSSNKGINFNNSSSSSGTTSNNYFGKPDNSAAASGDFKGNNAVNGGDPRFVSATDFHIQSGSVLIGKGTTVSVGFDKDGKGRTEPFDIGAYASAGGPAPSPTATPTPPPPKFIAGDTVSPTAVVNVRSGPASAIKGTQDVGAIGTIVSGPVDAPLNGNIVHWYEVDFTSPATPDGSVGDDNLEKAKPSPSPTPPAPTPSPSASPSPTPSPTPGETLDQWIGRQNDWIRSNPPPGSSTSKDQPEDTEGRKARD
jgi:hypothetical protein